jgi:hypothetical protein
VQNHSTGEPTQSQFEYAQQHPLHAQSFSLREARLYKVALTHIQEQKLTKEDGILTTFLRFVGLKSYTANALVAIIKWVVIALLSTVGLLAVDDAAHSLIGSPSHTDYSPSGAGAQQATEVVLPVSTQNTFKVNPTYQEERFNATKHWIEPVPVSQIGDEIVQWTHSIYPDTKNLTAEDIKNTSGFNQVLQLLDKYNSTNTLNITFMPPAFTSRKRVVDTFIDELAQKSPSLSAPSNKPHILNAAYIFTST